MIQGAFVTSDRMGSRQFAEARAEVERLAAGIPVSALATPPTVLRDLAGAALCAERTAAARALRLGARPGDASADRVALDAWDDLGRAVDEYEVGCDEAQRAFACGNVMGVAGLVASGALVLAGVDHAHGVVASFVLGAASGPVLGGGVGLLRRQTARNALDLARLRWRQALDATGLETLGALRARSVARNGWERRSAEVELLRCEARRRREAWHRIAGPKTAPERVEELVDRIEAVRQAQLRLVKLCFEEVLRRESDGPAVVVDLVRPLELAADEPNRFEALLEKMRGRRLRLWSA